MCLACMAMLAGAVFLLLRTRTTPRPTPVTTLAPTLTPSPYTNDLGWIDPKTGAMPNTPIVNLKGSSAEPGRRDARPGQPVGITAYSPGFFQLYPTDVYTDILVAPGFIAKLTGPTPLEVMGSFDHHPIVPPNTGFTSMTVRQT